MRKLLLLFAVLFTCNLLNAQVASIAKGERYPLNIGIIDHVQSAVLNEGRTLNIYLPDGYDKDTTTKYPVIYLLDGSKDEDFIHVVGVVQFLTMIQAMPNSIVVGIANVDRKRDFTYPSTSKADVKLVPTSGGSAKFMIFLETELQPHIQKFYKVSSSKTLIGQSLGGLLATEVLLKKPSLFNQYIIVRPSLWWDTETLLNGAVAMRRSHSYKGIKAYLAVGSEGPQMIGDAKKLSQILKADRDLKSTYSYLPKEDHLTILHNAVYEALLALNKKAR
ncbi:alpha/beta hydrolase [Mucilaginibacter sp. ZT4R22]|uniref:Alpha/beta hydrolase n=1 Tax=Mucilaginibacter pankratovii TaxID=2772110 RepID=A0ABR7WU23_9SPHI|nr:alpha/beta hydrolase-fold protein [Mucilaginibacter pankratovii]MBD1364757.1 alpha/beta hydrolase [Mucilaginibacter pankratovii]